MEKGKKSSALALVQERFEKTVREENMLPLMRGGVLLALSGGVDSSLLLVLLQALCQKEGFPLEAMHVNHGIRGEEALRDERFCASLCKDLGVPLHIAAISVPALAEEEGKGIEETARKHRYAHLEKKREERGLSAIVTAHNANDNAETVLLHLVRGTGLRGLCGIPAVRGRLLRPLLRVTKEMIYEAAREASLSFVEDSTNGDVAYARNYIRHELFPRMERLNPSLCDAFSRMTVEVGRDAAYLDCLAKEKFEALYDGKALCRAALSSLPYSLAYRLLLLLHGAQCEGAEKPSALQIEGAVGKIQSDACGSLSFPSAFSLVVERESVFFRIEGEPLFDFGEEKIRLGENCLANGGILYVSLGKEDNLFTNLHKPVIHRTLSSATIQGELFVRSKREGDSYRYGGRTRKLKKLFSDASVPPHLRSRVPVLCDEKGIVWVAGFGVREDNEKDKTKVYNQYHIYYIEA
ncbi:MAG: tRNA lysidine(34) synthetase TilS [Clostridia bacterium]|nr:tRNA lysidine(34) synthetase TilS [Clostridia bacterium]